MHLIISRVGTIISKSKNLYFPCDFFIDSWIIFKYFIEFPNIWEGGSVSKYLNVTNFNLIVVIKYILYDFKKKRKTKTQQRPQQMSKMPCKLTMVLKKENSNKCITI